MWYLAGQKSNLFKMSITPDRRVASPVADIAASFAQPQAQARGMAVSVDHPRLGPIRQVGVPFKPSATPASIRTAPPLLGEHSDEVLAALGYDESAIARLRAEGVVQPESTDESLPLRDGGSRARSRPPQADPAWSCYSSVAYD